MKMKKLLALLVASVLIPGAAMSQSVYAVNTAMDLYIVDLSNGNKTLVGNTGVFLESIGRNPVTNVLFGADTSGNIYTLSTVNGAATFLGASNLGNLEGMDFAGTNLWVTDFQQQMSAHLIDQSNGSVLGNIPTNFNTGAVRAMTFDSSASDMWFAGDEPGPQGLYAWDGINAPNLVGTLTNFTAAIQIIGNTMYGLGDNGQIYTISMVNGAMTQIANTGNDFWLGVATVPEPGTVAVIGLGLAALAARRRKK